MFSRYKIHFTRHLAPHEGRPERDANVERLKRFVSSQGLNGELDRILPSAAFGIVEVRCTPELAERLCDMSEVETVIEG